MAPKKKRKHNGLTDGKPEGESCHKKVKSDSDESDGMGPIDFSSPRTVFESLIQPSAFDDFFSDYWEKRPLVIHRADSFPNFGKYCANIFSKSIFEQLLAKQNLRFAVDANAVRFTDEKQRLDLNGKGLVKLSKYRDIFEQQKGTMQIHQPQRFQDDLWRILENLESFFGCLVGSNVYMTPPEAQGLPPHHDDVEVFILQLEGQKRWRLYKPIVDLPQQYSGDLSEDKIGNPVMDFTLKPGDLLYFPRGTIHQADTIDKDNNHSTHITISTYQHHTWGDYLISVFPRLLEDAIAKDVSFRKGLPINFLRSSKLSKSGKLNSLIDLLLKKIKYEKYVPPEGMIEDFMRNRLPPYGLNRKKLQDSILNGPPPGLSSKIRLKFSDQICYLIKKDICFDESDEESCSGEEDTSDDDQQSEDSSSSHSMGNQKANEKEMLFVFSSLFNDRNKHMMDTSMEPEVNHMSSTLKFPPSYVEGLNFLKSNADRFIIASEVPLDSGADVESLLRGLWASHLLEVQPSKSKKTIKAVKLD